MEENASVLNTEDLSPWGVGKTSTLASPDKGLQLT
jgi:hypothetical protein